MERRKICVVTGSRAEYGLLQCLVRLLHDDAGIELQLIATGAHLSPEFGMTARQIDFPITARVEMLLSGDTPSAVTKSLGLGVIGFADALERLRPDLMIVLGDRFEILAAVQAAMVARVPIAHIHGGELTEGAIDDAIRHAITKMSHLHFVAAEEYRRRVIQMGEQPDRVFTVGALALDHIAGLELMTRDELAASLGIEFGERLFLVTYHPVTLDGCPREAMAEMLAALDEFPEATVLITYPNADTDGRVLIEMIDSYAAERPRVSASASLGLRRYLTALCEADAVIGNSSSGIIEAPAMRCPTVNLGRRQDGRLKAASVLDCGESRGEIAASIRTALSPAFRRTAADMTPLYGEPGAAAKIFETVRTAPLSLTKRFNDCKELVA